jgi:hypothetical protein
MASSTHGKGEVDWRRIANDRNIAHNVARELWQRARAISPNDMRHAEQLFKHLLDEASVVNATNEPGRETLVDSRGIQDPASLGPGKTTRVLQEYPTAKNGKGPTPGPVPTDSLHRDLVAFGDAYKELIDLLKSSSKETIMEALRELQEIEGPAVVQNLVKMAGGAIEKIFQQFPPAQQGK